MPDLNYSPDPAVLESSGTKASRRSPWAWIPTLYLVEGVPNALVTTVSLVLYKSLGISNTRIAIYTGLFYLPWVLKPLWSPVVDLLKTRRLWVWRMQWLLAACLAGLALTLPTPWFVPCSLVCFFLLLYQLAQIG